MSLMFSISTLAFHCDTRQAKDQDLILWATEIKVRAERRAGEMLAEAKRNGELASSSSGGKLAMAKRWDKPLQDGNAYPPTLADIGVSEHQSSRWQALAAMPEEHFETAMTHLQATNP